MAKKDIKVKTKKKIKTKIFQLPYIGYDTLGKYNIVLGLKANPIFVFKIENPIEEFSADLSVYDDAHIVFEKVLKTMGVGYILQKIDIIQKNVYERESRENEKGNIMLDEFHESFKGRIFKEIETYIAVTPTFVETNRIFKHNKKVLEEIENTIDRVFLLLKEGGLNPCLLNHNEIDHLIKRQTTINYVKNAPIYADNIVNNEYDLNIGRDKISKILSVVDTENMVVPDYVSDVAVSGGKNLDDIGAFPIDNFHFLLESNDYNTIVFNQVVEIPEQRRILLELQNKKKRSEGMKNGANELSAIDIGDMLDDVSADNELISRAHFSIQVTTSTRENLSKVTNFIESELYNRGFIINRNALNQKELFDSFFIGNANGLRSYDLFLTKISSAVAFFFKEKKIKSDDSDFYVYLNDREGRPIRVDTDELPMRTQRINNRNMFMIGGSGTGKSFTMNTFVSQWVKFDTEVVIIDVGDSYLGLCDFLGGKYITYKEDKPITMNPFFINKEERNNEKIQFLHNLIVLLYKGTEGVIDDIEKEIIGNCVIEYFNRYFNEESKDWYKEKDTQLLIDYVSSYGENIDYDDFKSDKDTQLLIDSGQLLSYYAILNIEETASLDAVKSSYRNLAKKYHPDKGDGDVMMFIKITNAYDEILKEKASYKAKNKRELVEYKVVEIEEKLEVTSLCFNSFFEFSLKYIDMITRGRNVNFHLSDYKYKLSKFYTGGRFEKLLNENSDTTLFDEKFIVFEIDNIKDDPVLFPIVTLIIMDLFIQKMRLKKTRKTLIIEEAWKALTSKLMSEYILYLYKTVRKFLGQCIIVTQEINDIISNPIVKESIINNSDKTLLMDMDKFKNRFDDISQLLGIDKVEVSKILTINKLDNKENRRYFKEFYLKIGERGTVYGNEVSLFQYYAFTTEKTEKFAVGIYAKEYGNYEKGILQFLKDMESSKMTKHEFIKNIINTEQVYEKANHNVAI